MYKSLCFYKGINIMLDEDLEFIITNGWVEFGKLGYRSCPIEELRPYKE